MAPADKALSPAVQAAIDEWHRTLPERIKLAEMIFGPEDESLVTSPVDYSVDEPDPAAEAAKKLARLTSENV